MKQALEEAAKECRRTTAQSMGVYAQYHSIDECPNHGITYDEIAEAAFIKGAEWQEDQAIEILSSVLENWVHGGDADCIIAEFEEKLNNM